MSYHDRNAAAAAACTTPFPDAGTAGARLVALRNHHGLSRLAVSQRIGMKRPQNYRFVETDRIQLAPAYYARAAGALGLDPGHLARRLLEFYNPELFRRCFAEGDLGDGRLGPPQETPPPGFTVGEAEREELRRRMGERLRQARTARKLSQHELGERMGYPRYHVISLYERGVNAVAIRRYLDYAAALETKPGPLIETLLAHYEPVMHHYLFRQYGNG